MSKKTTMLETSRRAKRSIPQPVRAAVLDEGGMDWAAFDAMTNDEVIARALTDPDNPPWSEEMLGVPVLKRGRGPQRSPAKVITTVRLDADVIAFFKSQGRGYQTRINDELRKVLARGHNTSPRRAQKNVA